MPKKITKKPNKQEREEIEQERSNTRELAFIFYFHLFLRVLTISSLSALLNLSIYKSETITKSETIAIIVSLVSSLMLILTIIGLCIQIHAILKIIKYKKLNSKSKNKEYYNELSGFYILNKTILGFLHSCTT
ncbi:MAG: hypothetical protein LBV22_02060 [Mycoplasmataceae bacterium]|jgi:formate-dependent nitrite reductase membrane component NrfD|nr:hypothetical protein [Mycoplasmataceae bacterium]